MLGMNVKADDVVQVTTITGYKWLVGHRYKEFSQLRSYIHSEMSRQRNYTEHSWTMIPSRAKRFGLRTANRLAANAAKIYSKFERRIIIIM
jgi:hypothetical protein